ncbi:MAG TPA: hypothetical protein DIV86_03980, partial [Alphaproteobacteria bacterium]|nr:hypothetical protein [Alphaproteobacteria bacterium]
MFKPNKTSGIINAEHDINFDLLYKKAKTIKDHQYFIKKGLTDIEVKVINTDACFPLIDKSDTIVGLQFISPEGNKRFAKGSKKKGAGYLLSSPDSNTLLVCEGVATAISLNKATLHNSFACFDAGNISSCVQMLKEKFPRLQLIICGDNDAYGDYNTGVEKSQKISEKFAVPYCYPTFTDSSAKPTDFNDLYQLQGPEAVVTQVATATVYSSTTGSTVRSVEGSATAPATDVIVATEPYGFEKRNGSLYKLTRNGSFRICSYIEAFSISADKDDENHGLHIGFLSVNKRKKLLKISKKSLVNGREIISTLLSSGLDIEITKKTTDALIEYLSKLKPNKTLLAVDKMGWYAVDGENVYAAPLKIYSNIDKVLYTSDNAANFGLSGSLTDWQENIGKYLSGNPALIASVAVPFAAALIKPTGMEGGAFNFFGTSAKGKSTSLKIAGSVCGVGGENGFVKQCRNTDNSYERIAERHNDAALILDELDQSDEKTFFKTLYMLPNGQGKGRLDSTTGLKKVPTWRILILCSGEKPIEEKVRSSGAVYQAGINTRFCDIEYKGKDGMFDSWHEFESPEAFANHLNYATTIHYGTPFDTYMDYIKNIGHSEIKQTFDKNYKKLSDQYKLKFFDSQVKRVLRRFALLFTGLNYAISSNVLSISTEEALSSVKILFELWVEGRGTKGKLEDTQIIQQIRYFFQSNQSKFQTLSSEFTDKQQFYDLGYIKNLNGIDCFLVKSEVFKTQVCKTHGRKRILEILKKYDLR